MRHKVGDSMERLEFNDYEDLACAVADTYDALDYDDEEDVAIIAKYDEARQIIKELLCLGYDIHSVEIHDELWESYDSEYIISLYDNSVWCEPMLRENGYIEDDSPVIYVLDNCSSKVIPYCKGKTVYEVGIGDECGCDECECACKKDEKPTTTSFATYKVNGKEVSKDEFDTAMSEIEDKYLDNVRDMLLGYCDVMDRMNQWRSRLFW